MKSIVFIVFGLLAIAQGRTIEGNGFYKPRIVNGENAELGERPFQISMQIKGTHWCGGSILNEYWVLTAAHCVYGRTARIFQIVTGTVDLREPYSVHQVEQIIYHEGYNRPDSYRNDIALMKVATPFVFSFRIQPIVLPQAHATVERNSPVVVSGWGDLEYLGEKPNRLQKATLYILDESVCRSYVSPNNLYETNVCANDPSTKRGDCNGDSGGPLTSNGVLTGIVSWSVKADGCGSPRYPNVYTRVSEYVDWINEHIKSTNN